MEERSLSPIARSLVVLSVVGAALLAGQLIVLLLLAASWYRTMPGLEGTLESLVDGQIDAGFEDPDLSPDDPLLRHRKVLLFQDVNARSAKDVSARLIFLNEADAHAPIDLYVATQGGWADSAFTIIDTIRTISAPVNAHAIGGCYSSGTLVLAAATGRRTATQDAILMVHANLADSDEPYSFNRLDRARYEQVWRRTASLPDDWFPMTRDRTYYLSPEEALRLRIIDAIEPVWPGEE